MAYSYLVPYSDRRRNASLCASLENPSPPSPVPHRERRTRPRHVDARHERLVSMKDTSSRRHLEGGCRRQGRACGTTTHGLALVPAESDQHIDIEDAVHLELELRLVCGGVGCPRTRRGRAARARGATQETVWRLVVPVRGTGNSSAGVAAASTATLAPCCLLPGLLYLRHLLHPPSPSLISSSHPSSRPAYAAAHQPLDRTRAPSPPVPLFRLPHLKLLPLSPSLVSLLGARALVDTRRGRYRRGALDGTCVEAHAWSGMGTQFVKVRERRRDWIRAFEDMGGMAGTRVQGRDGADGGDGPDQTEEGEEMRVETTHDAGDTPAWLSSIADYRQAYPSSTSMGYAPHLLLASPQRGAGQLQLKPVLRPYIPDSESPARRLRLLPLTSPDRRRLRRSHPCYPQYRRPHRRARQHPCCPDAYPEVPSISPPTSTSEGAAAYLNTIAGHTRLRPCAPQRSTQQRFPFTVILASTSASSSSSAQTTDLRQRRRSHRHQRPRHLNHHHQQYPPRTLTLATAGSSARAAAGTSRSGYTSRCCSEQGAFAPILSLPMEREPALAQGRRSIRDRRRLHRWRAEGLTRVVTEDVFKSGLVIPAFVSNFLGGAETEV
ncbi:hypothetical protein C8R45DRAFT_1102888 [Mycena sanguinolenta]|nr:hypothetical protein C8R45DRAFT_1102888 [Mycena sanguinolenta]